MSRSGDGVATYRFDLLVVEQDRHKSTAAVAEDAHAVHRNPFGQLPRFDVTACGAREVRKHA
jgi:hypothetical protein